MNPRARTAVRLRATAFALLAAVAFGAASAAAGDLSLDELMNRLQARPHRHDTFTERYTTAILERALEASGELFYDAPDHLEKRTLRPHPERLVLERGELTIERHQRSYRTTLAEYPEVAPYIDSIRSTLAGDRAGLERVFRLAFSSNANDWALELKPLPTPAPAQVRRIRIEGTLDTVRTVLIERANGDRSLMTLTAAASP